MTMDYTKRDKDLENLTSDLKKVLEAYEKKLNCTVDFNTQKPLAEQGNLEAQFILGVLFTIGGRGVAPHFILAYMWFSLASSGDYADSRKYRNYVGKLLSVTHTNKAQDKANECQTNGYKNWRKTSP